MNSNYCAFARDGRKLWAWTFWQFFPTDFVRGTGAIGADGMSYFAGDDHRFWAIAPDGKWKWVTWLTSKSTSSPAFGADGTAYIGSHTYKFLGIKGASPPAKSSWPMFRADARHTGRVQIAP